MRVRQAQLAEQGHATDTRVGYVEEQYAKVRAKMRVMRVRTLAHRRPCTIITLLHKVLYPSYHSCLLLSASFRSSSAYTNRGRRCQLTR